MQILVFGVGNIYQSNKEYISKDDRIVGFLDNNPQLWRENIDGISVYSPESILDLFYEKIILMSVYAVEMRKQLLELGCKKENIVHYTEYINKQNIMEYHILLSNEIRFKAKYRCLIISDTLGYHGGALAAIYAAYALKKQNYEVIVAAPDADSTFIKEMRTKGISFVLYKNLAHAKEDELTWIGNFDYVFVNTLPMICCAIEIAKNRKVILWLHESLNIYKNMQYWYEEIKEGLLSENLKIYAVSNIAKDNFIHNYLGKNVQILPYGIPEELVKERSKKNRKLIFAIVGPINEQKGQDIFLDAIEKVNDQSGEGEFWIIGKKMENDYVRLIEKGVEKNPNIRIVGELTRTEMIQYYQKVDILVVASRQETMSLVATEAMMHGKVCIISDIAGMADYITDYFNGLIFKKEDSNELAKRILWCISNIKQLNKIGKEARLTYEKNFSMDEFGKRLQSIICEKL